MHRRGRALIKPGITKPNFHLFYSLQPFREIKKAIPQITARSLQLCNSRITNPAHKYSQVSSAVFSFPIKHFPQQNNLPSPSQVVEIFFFFKACQNLVLNVP